MEYTAKVDLAAIVELVDSEFDSRHPELKGRKVKLRSDKDGAKDEALRAEWNEMFTAEAMKSMRLSLRQTFDSRERFIAAE
jgi:hypothetical protein